MKIRVFIAVALMALLSAPLALFAQSAPAQKKPAVISLTLEYFENNSGAFEIRDEKGAAVPDPQMGDALKLGWTVLTGKGDVAELKMTHTGTIIKVAQNTNLKLEKLRSETGGQDTVSLAVGKIRTVVGKASGKDQYQIRTGNAVCGVRGSDVVIEFQEGSFAKLSTLEGTGWIQNADGKALEIAQGFSADALAAAFEAAEMAKDVLDALNEEMKFVQLSVDDAMAANQEYQKALADAAAAAQAAQVAETATTTEKTETKEEPKKEEAKTPAWLDSIMDKLKDILGMEIGSLNIGGVTYATLLVQPTFELGDFKAALYLPIIYQGDMFNPSDWYHPLGNDEWSFGTDQTGTWNIVKDAASDVFLKIRYIEWGDQRDPFFFKVGNLDDITIGHGLIMRNFANDADFPAVRRVGVNVGADFSAAGIEAMVNDATSPDVVGGRFYVRPIKSFKAAIGVEAVVDIDPAKYWPGGADLVGNPIFINPGVDLDLPFFESDFFSIVAFGDAALMVPWFLSVPTDAAYAGIYGNTLSGLATDAVLPYGRANYTDIQNWGVATGLFGNLITKDFTWRLEYRDYTGTFIPQFYNSGYERQRTQYLAEILAYLQDPTNSAYNTETMGIFGEGGFTLSKIFSLELSYFWPWERDGAGALNFSSFGDDHFVAKFTLESGVIPVVGIYGSVSYERTNFMPTILQTGVGAGLGWLDANTVVSAEIGYPVTDNLDLTLLYTTTPYRNVDGNLVYPDGPTGLPQMETTLSIMTKIHL